MEDQTVTAPGHGSAKTASRASTGGCAALMHGRSSAKACTGPAAGGGAETRKRGGDKARSNTSGSIERALTSRLSVSLISCSSIETPPRVDRQPDDVAGGERELAPRQGEIGALAPGPQILQPDFRPALASPIVVTTARSAWRCASDPPTSRREAAARAQVVGADIGESRA